MKTGVTQAAILMLDIRTQTAITQLTGPATHFCVLGSVQGVVAREHEFLRKQRNIVTRYGDAISVYWTFKGGQRCRKCHSKRGNDDQGAHAETVMVLAKMFLR
jgi:hypothetical protein